jgi:hypothetical protein
MGFIESRRLAGEFGQEKLLLGIKEAATSLGIGITLMRQLITEGAVQSVHVAGRHLVPTESLREYVSQQIVESLEKVRDGAN